MRPAERAGPVFFFIGDLVAHAVPTEEDGAELAWPRQHSARRRLPARRPPLKGEQKEHISGDQSRTQAETAEPDRAGGGGGGSARRNRSSDNAAAGEHCDAHAEQPQRAAKISGSRQAQPPPPPHRQVVAATDPAGGAAGGQTSEDTAAQRLKGAELPDAEYPDVREDEQAKDTRVEMGASVLTPGRLDSENHAVDPAEGVSTRWADMCSEQDDSTEMTDAERRQRGAEDAAATTSPGVASTSSVEEQIKEGNRRKGRRRTRRGRRSSGDPTVAEAPPTTSTMIDSAEARLMRTALDFAEKGDHELALVAFHRLMQSDVQAQLPRESLFQAEHVRVKHGWQTTLHLAMGKQVSSGVHGSVSAAHREALAESMEYVIKMVHYIATTAARRAREQAASSCEDYSGGCGRTTVNTRLA